MHATLTVHQQSFRYIPLRAQFGTVFDSMPWVMRILMENVLRNADGEETSQAVTAMLGWLESGTSQAEIAFKPCRILMHDTTCTPALVDIAAMRDVLAEHGVDPSILNPHLSVNVSVDHSLAVEAYATKNAISVNLMHEMRRNHERYQFLRWAGQSLRGVTIHPPGTGIMHTINLEQLARLVQVEEKDGEKWIIPDTLIGTDSHTPMINGIGVLGWGVGGLEAQTVMFGMPTLLRLPDVIGVKLDGEMKPGRTVTDLALAVTRSLRKLGVSGEFVEFYGPGVSTLSTSQRAVIANMAPEYGATTGYFAPDESSLSYLIDTGRSTDLTDLARAYLQQSGLWFDPDCTPIYTQSIAIDLSEIETYVAGPQRPQDLLTLTGASQTIRDLAERSQPSTRGLPTHPVAIAAITSCTNTSDPGLLMTAGLLARKARALGLRTPEWVKTSLAPGSPAAERYLRRADLLQDLEALGFDIVGYGCTTCIGNAGPLPEIIDESLQAGEIQPVAVLSGNRNFPGRIHPDLDLAFIMSPPLVVAYALAGDASKNLDAEPLGTTKAGESVWLSDIWPSPDEIREAMTLSLDASDYRTAFEQYSANPEWHAIPAPHSSRFPWRQDSTTLRRPPFASLEAGSLLGTYEATSLLVLGDDVTTDHISPASAIPRSSFIGEYLIGKGEDPQDLNVFASRRGNWEVMMRAAFFNKSLKNLLWPDSPAGYTIHAPTAEVIPIWEAARRYETQGQAVVIVAGERYGTGSSRDWAAKGQRLLGVRAVLANSFERIHRSNLIGMGIAPIQLPKESSPEKLNIAPGDLWLIDLPSDQIGPRCKMTLRLKRRTGAVEYFDAMLAVETRFEVSLLQHGGVIPKILSETLGQKTQTPR